MTSEPERSLYEQVADAMSALLARYWYAEAKKIEEATDDPQARWEILTQALLRIGWPERRPPG